MPHRKPSHLQQSLLWLAVLVATGTAYPFLPAAIAMELPPIAVDTVAEPATLSSGSIVTGDSLASQRPTTNDSATLLNAVPGVALATGGGVSSLPVIHGMADDRNKILIDGMPITSACGNHMNPAMSYIDPANVAKVGVITGITPVSAGGDSIGGSITVESAQPIFAAPGEGIHTEGMVSAFSRSINHSLGGSFSSTVANQNLSLGYTGAMDRAGDYQDGHGNSVRSTLYETQNHALTLALQGNGTLLVVKGGVQHIPYQGFPNQRMDMTGNNAGFLNLEYTSGFDWGKLNTKFYWQDTRHEMNFLTPDKSKTGLGMPMNTHGVDLGYSLKAEIPVLQTHTLRLGHEFHRFTLDDWWPPVSATANGMMSPNIFININDGQRDQWSVYAEMESRWSSTWSSLLGLRGDLIRMDSGPVQGYSANGMAKYAVDSAAFNSKDRARQDTNFDLTALLRHEPNPGYSSEIGYSRKTRSPNLYERYAWSTGSMASDMVTWFGDANGYVGNLNLKPEVAHTVSASADWHDRSRKAWGFKVTPYYTYIQDFIDVDKRADNTSNFSFLTFANHDARMVGVDISGSLGVWDHSNYGRGQLKGVVGWVQGKRSDAGSSLYHMMPLNGRVSLEQSLDSWSNAVDWQLVDEKSRVDPLRKEPTTPGYGLINWRTGYQWQPNVHLDFAITNLLDKYYYLPLGGVDYADWNQTKASAATPIGALPGPGRSFNLGMTVKF